MWDKIRTDVERIKTNITKITLIVQSQQRIGLAPAVIKQALKEARVLHTFIKADVDRIDGLLTKLEEKHK